MDNVVTEAYDKLVPTDQLVIDALILTLFKKDMQISHCVAEINKQLDQAVEDK